MLARIGRSCESDGQPGPAFLVHGPLPAQKTACPIRAQGTGFALVDGVGHVGGALAIVVVVPIFHHPSPLGAFLLLAAFEAVAGLLLQLAPRTRDVPLDVLSP